MALPDIQVPDDIRLSPEFADFFRSGDFGVDLGLNTNFGPSFDPFTGPELFVDTAAGVVVDASGSQMLTLEDFDELAEIGARIQGGDSDPGLLGSLKGIYDKIPANVKDSFGPILVTLGLGAVGLAIGSAFTGGDQTFTLPEPTPPPGGVVASREALTRALTQPSTFGPPASFGGNSLANTLFGPSATGAQDLDATFRYGLAGQRNLADLLLGTSARELAYDQEQAPWERAIRMQALSEIPGYLQQGGTPSLSRSVMSGIRPGFTGAPSGDFPGGIIDNMGAPGAGMPQGGTTVVGSLSNGKQILADATGQTFIFDPRTGIVTPQGGAPGAGMPYGDDMRLISASGQQVPVTQQGRGFRVDPAQLPGEMVPGPAGVPVPRQAALAGVLQSPEYIQYLEETGADAELRGRYTAETGRGAQAGDRNAEQAARAGGLLTPGYLAWLQQGSDQRVAGVYEGGPFDEPIRRQFTEQKGIGARADDTTAYGNAPTTPGDVNATVTPEFTAWLAANQPNAPGGVLNRAARELYTLETGRGAVLQDPRNAGNLHDPALRARYTATTGRDAWSAQTGFAPDYQAFVDRESRVYGPLPGEAPFSVESLRPPAGEPGQGGQPGQGQFVPLRRPPLTTDQLLQRSIAQTLGRPTPTPLGGTQIDPARLADPIQDELTQQVLNVARGDLSNPTLAREFQEEERTLRNALFQRLGPSYESSSEGLEAMQKLRESQGIRKYVDQQNTLSNTAQLQAARRQFNITFPEERFTSRENLRRGWAGTLLPAQLERETFGEVKRQRGLQERVGLSTLGRTPLPTLSTSLSGLVPITPLLGLGDAAADARLQDNLRTQLALSAFNSNRASDAATGQSIANLFTTAAGFGLGGRR